jgi:hypothetical protein
MGNSPYHVHFQNETLTPGIVLLGEVTCDLKVIKKRYGITNEKKLNKKQRALFAMLKRGKKEIIITDDPLKAMIVYINALHGGHISVEDYYCPKVRRLAFKYGFSHTIE